jgi:hypothetical protein
MLFLLALSSIIVVALLAIVVLRLRYEFKHVALCILVRLQKRNIKIVNTSSEIRRTLLLADKGTCIEELFASQAWLPIISIESVNGNKWIELKKNFLIFQKCLPSTNRLGLLAIDEMKRFVECNQNLILDSKMVSILTLKVFLKWLFFDEDWENDTAYTTTTMLETIYESSLEYRKEIAMKGKGCQAKKQHAIDIVIDLLNKSETYKNIFADWSVPECFSIVMQPFVISPMINVSDIAVAIKKHRSTCTDDMDSFLDHCIRMEHPFPVLERYDATSNTQIFVFLSDIKLSDEFNYGFGPRACLGRVYAKEFMRSFFSSIFMFCKDSYFQPDVNHLYSGRDNDKTDLKQTIYQLGIFYKTCTFLLKKSLRECFTCFQ